MHTLKHKFTQKSNLIDFWVMRLEYGGRELIRLDYI